MHLTDRYLINAVFWKAVLHTQVICYIFFFEFISTCQERKFLFWKKNRGPKVNYFTLIILRASLPYLTIFEITVAN